VTQREIFNVLESAGLSFSNPYNVVEQGKVASLTVMKDHERLNLLKEVAGTRVYDTKRAESLKIMRDSEQKIKQIDEVIETIEERLSELEREKKELKEFQDLDKKRIVLSNYLYDYELKDANRQLEDINNHRQGLHKESADSHLKKQALHYQMKDIERTIKEEELKLSDLRKQRQIFENQRETFIRERTKTELELASIQQRFETDNRQKETIQQELSLLEKEIATARREIESVIPELNNAKRKEATLRDELHRSEQRLAQLYSKQGRKTNFATQEDRDRWLREQITKQTDILTKTTDRISTLEGEIQELTRSTESLQQGKDNKGVEIDRLKSTMETLQRDYAALSEQRNALADERKQRWKEENEAQESVKKAKEDLTRAQRRLESTLPRSLSRGIEEVKRIVREQNIQGMHGPVIELFTTRETYHRACEVTAGNSLFHIVVETDKVAAEILAIMNRQQSKGRVTFMPLNRITGRAVEAVTDPMHTPLLNKLNFEPRFRHVFSRIFGGTFISQDLGSAAAFARTNNVDCVTLKGDQVNKRGALTGGYAEERDSRLECMSQIKKLQDAAKKANNDAKKSKETLAALDKQITAIVGQMTQLEAEMHKTRNSIAQSNMEVSLQSTKAQQLQESVTQKQRTLERAREEQNRLQQDIENLRNELGTPLTSSLTDREQQELDNLNQEIDRIQKALRTNENESVRLETQRKMLLVQLNNNLLKRQAELEETIKDLQVEGIEELSRSPEQLQRTVDNLRSEVEQIDARLEELDKQMEDSNKVITDKQKELEDKRTEEHDFIKRLESGQNRLEKLLNRRRILEQKRDAAINHIRDLGAIPQVEVNVDPDNKEEIIKKLQKNKEKLKKFAHVNKKALDQYEQFKDQRTNFIAKKKELDDGAKAIQDLIKTLDQKKDEAIERTFKQVSTYFSQIFSELVPGGSARLVMTRQADTDSAEDTSSIGSISGVSITVKFTGDGEAQVMQQLSGGQKSIVALTLIFAIQRSDPAPFYLFDEIDAALDPNYRESVAQMVNKQSERTQFIITTFKTELLDHAHNFYGISIKNKVSFIRKIEKEDALRVLQEEERMEREGGNDEAEEPVDRMEEDD
jgi:structural maintenance of chromosome 3 (chondroitin sulfate proteoglycan 6)